VKVLVRGAGLIGASVGLALKDAGWQVFIQDQTPEKTAEIARLTGLAVWDQGSDPDIVVVAVHPDEIAQVILDSLQLYRESTVIDVASTKNKVQSDIQSFTQDFVRFIPTHPLAGKEVSGAIHASEDLFVDRTWVVCPSTDVSTDRLSQVLELVRKCGATPLMMTAAEHDQVVAVTSHLPQILSSALAARLLDLTDDSLAVSGSGLRDMTRLAQSQSALWTQIVLTNNKEILKELKIFIDNITSLQNSLLLNDAMGIQRFFDEGNQGKAHIPGKHGGSSTAFDVVYVVIDDRPGQLAALFTLAGYWNINIEDVRINHSLGKDAAVIELYVLPEVSAALLSSLQTAGWRVQ